MSRMGVLSTMSAPRTISTGPSGVERSTLSRRTHDSPMGLGRNGERVANTPRRTLPPSLGGRTVADQPSRWVREKRQISQMCENPSRPRSASGER